MKTAIVTGVTGQDGAYLTELLLRRGYSVYGTYRRGSSVNFWRLQELGVLEAEGLKLVEYDLLDMGAAYRLIEKSKPDYIFNLAAQSFVGVSFDQPFATAQMTGVGPLNLLEAIRVIDPGIRFYQASSSEIYGKVQAIPQNEDTPFYPRSPYAAAKLFAHWMTVNYRESYGLHATSGILFNHESPLRGQEFVTRKITNAVARIVQGKQQVIELGNLDAQRDWGYAAEYVEGMYHMLSRADPGNYVLATGEAHSGSPLRRTRLRYARRGNRLARLGRGRDGGLHPHGRRTRAHQSALLPTRRGRSPDRRRRPRRGRLRLARPDAAGRALPSHGGGGPCPERA